MQPETITAFPEKRWARATKTAHGVHLRYGIGKLCSSYTLFADPIEALFAHVAWEQDGIEPKRVGTLQGMPRIADEQLEAMRFEAAAEQLEARRHA